MRQLKILLLFFLSLAFLFVSKEAYAQYCGDGTCDAGESLATCPEDCTPICAAPTILSHSDTDQSGGGTVTFSWSSVPTATQYEIQRQNIFGSWLTRGTTGATSWGPDTDGINDPNWRVRVSLENGSTCTAPGYWRTFDPGAPTPTNTPTPTPTPGPSLSVKLSGRVNSGDLWSIHKVNGDVPLNDVDLQASVIGAPGSIQYRFDCTNDSTYEHDATTSTNPYSVLDLCDYSTAGPYTARVRVDSGGNFAEDFLPINVDSSSSLSVAIEGRVNPSDPWLTTEVSGNAPLNNVDFRDTVTGGSGSIQYRFDCTNDSTYEHDTTASTNPYSVLDLCDYSTAGPYIARTRTDNGGLEAYDSLTITVSGTGGGGSSISGRVYVDENRNGVQDCNGACDNGSGDESGYSGASISVSGVGADTTNYLGEYSFSSLTNGSYDITLTVPAGYTATTTNPVNRSVPPNATANFGLGPNAPVCTSLDSSEPTVSEGGSSTLTATGCVPPIPTPTYSWPPPTCVPPGSCGTVIDVNDPSTTYTAPSDICEDTTVTASVDVTNSEGTNRTSTNINVTPRNVISGGVFEDTEGNSCASGATPYGAGAVITVYNGGIPTGNDTADGSGSYLVTDNTACSNKTAVISSIPNYHINAVRFDGGAWSPSGFSGFTYGPFNFSADHTLDFCISDVVQWFQTSTGDVRMNALTNKVPSGQFSSNDNSNPSVFYSSNFAAEFGTGGPSILGWKVDDEYSYQDDSKNRNGTTSYSFYKSRAEQKGIEVAKLPQCGGQPDCTIEISNRPTGAYETVGNLTITSYSHRAGSRVLILVGGNLTINSDISVPTSALLIIAAKGNITIDKSIGTTALTSTAPHIEGIFTAEGSVIADGDGCPSLTPDKRLNVEGALIANSLKPFTVGGSGFLVNARSLCLDDRNYPSVYVAPRYDFVTQLTDFYKTSYIRWREVNP